MAGHTVRIRQLDSNSGHCALDTIHPPFQQLRLWQSRVPGLLDGPFQFFLFDDAQPYKQRSDVDANEIRCLELAEVVAGKPMLWRSAVASAQWVRFESFFTGGGGNTGVSSYTTELRVGGIDAMSVMGLRDRIYRGFGVAAAPQPGVPRTVLWLPNKRGLQLDRPLANLQQAVETRFPSVAFHAVQWGKSLAETVRLFASADVIVTGPGTSGLNQLFCRNGTVAISLGHRESGHFQYIDAPFNYVRSLYHPPHNNLLNVTKLVELVGAALASVRHFHIPIPAADNLSAVGLACKHIMETDRDVWMRAIGHGYGITSCVTSYCEPLVWNDWGKSCPFSQSARAAQLALRQTLRSKGFSS